MISSGIVQVTIRGVDITWDYEYYRRDYAGIQKITVGITRDYKKKPVGIIKIAVRRSGLHRDYKNQCWDYKLGLLTNIGLRCAYVGIVIGLHWDYQDYIYLFRIPFGVATLRLSPGSSGFVLGKGKHKMSVRP